MSKIKVVLIIFFAFLLSGCNTKNSTNPIIAPTPTIAPKLLTWSDPAGFSFEYSEGVAVNNHPEDTKNYANLTLTSASSEIMQITMSDNTFKSLDAWVGKNSAIDTTLGDKAAKKIIVDNQTTLACIDGDVLVTISGKDPSQIIDSWVFVYP
ncbi:hypothetical protein COS78_01440, partial [Candidatus Shapirobacteria bacterium CG06_land_8_20_14_3_00_40_12]